MVRRTECYEFMESMEFKHSKYVDDFRLVHTCKGTSNLPRRPKTVFLGLCFTPKLPPNLFFNLDSHLVLFLRLFVRKTVDDVVESSEHN